MGQFFIRNNTKTGGEGGVEGGLANHKIFYEIFSLKPSLKNVLLQHVVNICERKKYHPHQCKSYINRSALTNLILTPITNLIFHWEFQHYPEKA